LEAHSAGILSLSWCHLDHDLLLSCGKDNRTILWNPQTPKVLGEFPVASTWAFETQWCPQNPDILANATFEGKITVHRLQSTLPKKETNGTQAGVEDFFDQRQYVSEGGFELKQAPKWLQVPCGASFGFGGTFVSVRNVKSKGEVKISKYISEPKISENASEFEEAIRTADWTTFCTKQAEKSTTDSERSNWDLLRVLFDTEPRKKLIEYLGIKNADLDALLEKTSASKLEKTDSEATATADESTNTLEPERNNHLSGIFGPSDKTDDFLSQLTPNPDVRSSLKEQFSITSTSENSYDQLITQAILFGRFDQAVDICLEENRLSDAFMLATQGDAAVRKKVQDAYFARNSHSSSYLRLLQSIVDSNLWDVAEYADLTEWKQILVLFCTFAKTDEEFSRLCEVLGQRLEKANDVENAKTSYLAGHKLDSVVDIWISEANMQEKEELRSSQNDSAFSIHVRALQGFVEKVTVFKQTKGITGGDLKALYDKYIEFVEVLASQGNLSVAQRYVDLLPSENEAVKAIKSRLSIATTKALTPTTPAKAGPRTAELRNRGLPPSLPTAFTPRQFTPTSPQPPQPPTFPTSTFPTTLPATSTTGPPLPNAIVRPSVYNPPSGQSQYTPQYPNQYVGFNPGLQPTNPAISRISDLPPPPPKKSTENWNDPPMLANPARTRTPIAPLVKPPSPFTGQSLAPTPTFQQKAAPGPPPTTAKPPQRVKSPPVSSGPVSGSQFTSAPPRQVMTPQGPPTGQFTPTRTPSNSFTPPPPGATYPPPPPLNGTFRPQSTPAQTPSQYASPPIRQTGFPAPSPASFPPPGQNPSQYDPSPARSQYTPAASPPPDSPMSPQARPAPPPAKFRTFVTKYI
jgi:protein transport protein SEC31